MKNSYEVFNQLCPPPQEHEKISKKSIVDPSGYVSPKERIENLMLAGERLDNFRRDFYHYGPDDKDDGKFVDPLLEPGLDLADVSRLKEDALSRLQEQSKPSEVEKAPESEAEPEQAHKSEVIDGS